MSPGDQSGRRLSRFLQHEATRRISSSPLPGWDATPSQCLAQEHDTMSPAGTARSRDERTNIEATAPPTIRSPLSSHEP